MADEFTEDVIRFTQDVNTLPVYMAEKIERMGGPEVGTKFSFVQVELNLQRWIEQAEDAITVLDDGQHEHIRIHLRGLADYYREVLAEVQAQLVTGDHLPVVYGNEDEDNETGKVDDF